MKSIKRALCLLLGLSTLILCGCNGAPVSQTEGTTTVPEETIDPNAPLSDGKTLKLLAITSSFGLNTTQWLYDVAVAEGCTDVVVGRLYGSGCTLKTHVENAENNTNYYQYTKIDSGKWNTMEGIPLKYGLQDEDWDIIFIQQSAAQAPQLHTYENYIDRLMQYVKENMTNPQTRFVWNMLWGYQGDSDISPFTTVFKSDQMYMYQCNVDAVKTHILPRADFDRIIPTGTVIQNARTSAFGDNLCKDTYHLNNYGGILAAYGLYSVLTGQELTEIHLDAVASSPNGIGGAAPITEPLTDQQKAIIIESVNNAIKDPYQVTESSYKN